MQSLQHKASEWSGVDPADAFAIDETNVFEKLGLQTFINLSTNFYNRVYDDEEEWFRSIFANSKKEDAIQNQYEFFVQRMGGPPLYSQRKGHPALIGRHRPFPVTHKAAERWLHHMQQALDSTSDIDTDSKTKMMNFFRPLTEAAQAVQAHSAQNIQEFNSPGVDVFGRNIRKRISPKYLEDYVV